jgi:hypothetical protein
MDRLNQYRNNQDLNKYRNNHGMLQRADWSLLMFVYSFACFIYSMINK